MATGRTGANIPHVQCPVEEEFKPVLGSATTPLRHTVAKIVSGRAKTSDNATIFRVQSMEAGPNGSHGTNAL